MKRMALVLLLAGFGIVGCGEKKNEGGGGQVGAVPQQNPWAQNGGFGGACPSPGQIPTAAGCLNPDPACGINSGRGPDGACYPAIVGNQYQFGNQGNWGHPGGFYGGNPGSGQWGGYPGYNYGYGGQTGFYWGWGSHPGWYSFY